MRLVNEARAFGAQRIPVQVEGDLIVPPGFAAFDADHAAIGVVVQVDFRGNVAEGIVDQRRLAHGREGIVRVQAAPCQGGRQGDGVGIDGRAVLDLRGRLVLHRPVVIVAGHHPGLGIGVQLGGEAAEEAIAGLRRLDVGIVEEVLRAVDIAAGVGRLHALRAASP